MNEVGGPVSQEDLRAVAESVRAAFPRPFSKSELVLIDVDPRHIHAFWTLQPGVLAEARSRLGANSGDAPLVLRFATDEPNDARASVFDVEILGLQGQTYVDIWDDARRYGAELGLRRSDGWLLPIVTSNIIELPRLGPAETAADVGDIRAAGAGTGGIMANHDLANIASPAADTSGATAAEPTPEPLAEPFPSPPAPMSEGAPPPPAPAEAGTPPPLALENVLSVSSFALGRETVQLEINAELHIFGRARPGSELNLFGRRVALRPDGTFSLTRPLPNGALILSALLSGGDDTSDEGQN
jgi:hypothetical protein